MFRRLCLHLCPPQATSVFSVRRLATRTVRQRVFGLTSVSAPKAVPDVTHIVAVGSGKGGVGKSTLAVNLALAMYQEGFSVGLLDADIYGPSVPIMMNLSGKRPVKEGGLIVPLENMGLRVVSMGMLIDPNAAVVWRGPMVGAALTQLLHSVRWGRTDVLVVDLPPGTGDAQLSLCQAARLSGAVIVSTPQDVALADARRAIHMFKQLDVPVLGIVENMSYYICPCCGTKTFLFGQSGAERVAAELHLPFLGGIPLEAPVRSGGDEGKPVVLAQPDSAAARAFRAVGKSVLDALEAMPASGQGEGPQIKVEL